MYVVGSKLLLLNYLNIQIMGILLSLVVLWWIMLALAFLWKSDEKH